MKLIEQELSRTKKSIEAGAAATRTTTPSPAAPRSLRGDRDERHRGGHEAQHDRHGASLGWPAVPASAAAYPLTVRFMPGESVRSYIHRLAQRNAFPLVQWICCDLGMRNIYSPLTEDRLRVLSSLSGTPAAELLQSRAGSSETQLVFEDEALGGTVVDREASRLCLQCFRENAFHRLAWDISALTVCPFHGSPIIRNCPECGAVLQWRRKALYKCPAGHCLTGGAETGAPIASGPALDGLRALYERVDPNPGWPSRLYLIPPEIRWLPLRDFIDALEVVGYINYEDQRRNRRLKHSAGAAPDHYLALARGVQAFRNWPLGFHQALDAIPGQENGLKIADISCPQRRRLHWRLERDRHRAFARVIGREIWAYAEARGVSLEPGAFSFTPGGFADTHVSATSARALMNVSLDFLRRVAVDKNWNGARQLRTGKSVWLRRADIDAWLKDNQKGQSARQLSKRFHVLRSVVLESAQRGLFGVQATQRRTMKRRLHWFALPREVDSFMRRVRESITGIRNGEDALYVTWSAFSKRPEAKHTSFAAVVEGVLNATVKASSLEGEDLTTLRFHVLDALKLAASAQGQGEADVRRLPFSVRFMAGHYKVQRPFLIRAIRLGILPVQRHGGAADRRGLTIADMDEFLERFATSGLVARRLSVSVKAAEFALKELGVGPYYEDGRRQTEPAIYSWDDIRLIGLDNVLAAAKKAQRRGKAQKARSKSDVGLHRDSIKERRRRPSRKPSQPGAPSLTPQAGVDGLERTSS